jgi:hypothetical protein
MTFEKVRALVRSLKDAPDQNFDFGCLLLIYCQFVRGKAVSRSATQTKFSTESVDISVGNWRIAT